MGLFALVVALGLPALLAWCIVRERRGENLGKEIAQARALQLRLQQDAGEADRLIQAYTKRAFDKGRAGKAYTHG